MKALFSILIIGLLSHTSIEFKTDSTYSSITIEGTSTLHDWEMKATKLEGSMKLSHYSDSIHLQELKLIIPVKSLQSGKDLMDKNAYKALKAETYPEIKYQLMEVARIPETGKSSHRLKAVGRLSISGRSKIIHIPVELRFYGEHLFIKGQTTFCMSDFGVEAPSFMFNKVKTGDEITIKFNINYK